MLPAGIAARTRTGAGPRWIGASAQVLIGVMVSRRSRRRNRRGQRLLRREARCREGAPRVHVDIHTDDVDAEVARLTALGASQVDRLTDWAVMRDPAGLPFCVVKAPPGELDDGAAITWH